MTQLGKIHVYGFLVVVGSRVWAATFEPPGDIIATRIGEMHAFPVVDGIFGRVYRNSGLTIDTLFAQGYSLEGRFNFDMNASGGAVLADLPDATPVRHRNGAALAPGLGKIEREAILAITDLVNHSDIAPVPTCANARRGSRGGAAGIDPDLDRGVSGPLDVD